MAVGSPHRLIEGLVRHEKKDLTLIVNDTARPGVGVGLDEVQRVTGTLLNRIDRGKPRARRRGATACDSRVVCARPTAHYACRCDACQSGGLVLVPQGVALAAIAGMLPERGPVCGHAVGASWAGAAQTFNSARINTTARLSPL